MAADANTGLAAIDICREDFQIVIGILKTYLPDASVYAFGSRARHCARRYSDLDLAVIAAQPLSLDQLAAIREAFTDSDLPWRVDVVDWLSASESFRAMVESDLVLIHGQNEYRTAPG